MENKTEKCKFTLRVAPWFTDGCSTFLNNLFKWLPKFAGKKLTVLEFGSGNSSLYFLSKGLKVISIESSQKYIDFVHEVAKKSGFRSIALSYFDLLEKNFLEEFDLVLIQASSFQEVAPLLDNIDYDIIVNDGIGRKEVAEKIFGGIEKIIVMDNVEYSANWGRLDRSSAKPDLIIAYRKILRSPSWKHYIFEQPEGRLGRGASDKTGWESPHRWASAVLWPSNHLLSELMVTNIGFPIVNQIGINNMDIQTLNERCPFDWNEMKWIKTEFPEDLDLKLERDFD